MNSHTSLVAQQTRLSEWSEMVRDCQNCLQGMKIDEWCQQHDITKASYYWRLRKVREAFLEVAGNVSYFIEVSSSSTEKEESTGRRIGSILSWSSITAQSPSMDFRISVLFKF